MQGARCRDACHAGARGLRQIHVALACRAAARARANHLAQVCTNWAETHLRTSAIWGNRYNATWLELQISLTNERLGMLLHGRHESNACARFADASSPAVGEFCWLMLRRQDSLWRLVSPTARTDCGGAPGLRPIQGVPTGKGRPHFGRDLFVFQGLSARTLIKPESYQHLMGHSVEAVQPCGRSDDLSRISRPARSWRRVL
jgi:hypothetical protein